MKTWIITIASILVICLLLSILCYVELGSFNFIRAGLALSQTMGQEGVYRIADRPEPVYLAGTRNALENFQSYLEAEGYTLRLDEQMGAMIPVEKDGRWDYVNWSVNAMYHKFVWQTAGDPARAPESGETVTLYTLKSLTGSAYFYPEKDTELSVQTDLTLTFRYPAADAFSSAEHDRLYWEGATDLGFPMEEGFCVKAGDTAAFLEESLEKLGLTPRERADLMVACLPELSGEWNLISFQAYTPVDVSPAPDTAIGILVLFKALDEPLELAPQTLTAPARDGFTAVQWSIGLVK